jgi:hypothetical protein
MQDKKSPDTSHPLGMTVYDLPLPAEVAQADSKRTSMGRFNMLLVLLACAAPVVASYITYYWVRPEARRNFGELIQPTRAIPSIEVERLDGNKMTLTDLKGQWLLVSVSGAGCDAACQQHLYLQRQILVGLGKERPRTQWVWLVNDKAEVPDTLLPALEEATVLRIDPKALVQWLQPEANKKLEDHLYMVDPMGEWMMRFPAQLNTEGALKAKHDMERLLRASASWDLPGR